MHLPDRIHFRASELWMEDVSLSSLAEKFDTPLYVYSAEAIVANLESYRSGFESISHTICYAMKANSNPKILRLLRDQGAGADIVSGGELYLARHSGIRPNKIVFAGVGKTEAEIRAAIQEKILLMNAESEQELRLISKVAVSMKSRAPVGIRVNPDIDPGTHPYISTGLKKHKFGIAMKEALDCYELASRLPGIEVVGVHMHLGSQVPSIAPILDGVRKVLKLVDQLHGRGINVRILDIGGGLGIRYNTKDRVFQPSQLGAAIAKVLKGRRLHVVTEPGRSIVGSAGVLLTRVLYTKRSGSREFVIVDAGMNDLIRPALYDAYHEVVPVVRRRRTAVDADIVGPVCETGDFLARERKFVRVNPGELLAILNTGAYGYSMSSNYNARPRPAEVLVQGSQAKSIRKRESISEMR